MADKKYAVRNTTRGVRGLNTTGGYRDLEPGELAEGVELTEAEYRNAESTGYFEFGSAAKAEPEQPEPTESVDNPTDQAAPSTPGDDLDRMSTDDLVPTVHALTGKAPPEKKRGESDDDYRARLLKLARGQE